MLSAVSYGRLLARALVNSICHPDLEYIPLVASLPQKAIQHRSTSALSTGKCNCLQVM